MRRDLDRRGGLGHEHLGRDAQLPGRVRRRQPGIATGGGHDAGRRQDAPLGRRDDLVEHAAGLEAAGVLRVLQLEPDLTVAPQHRGVPHPVADPPLGRPYVFGLHR